MRHLQVAKLRAERKTLVVDPRFTHVVEMVRSGYFGWEDYFGPIMDAITTGGDYYLVANDFPGYLEAQVWFYDQFGWVFVQVFGCC
jgi:starch phosphorylase